jgi:hypothetical protein
MCGACGILGGGPDWMDPIGHAAAYGGLGRTRLAERQRRLALANRLLAASGVRLTEQGRQIVVRSATGRSRIATDLVHVWAAADSLGRRPFDPLDETFLASLGAGDSAGG